MLFLTITIEGRLVRPPALPAPTLQVIELPPYQAVAVKQPEPLLQPERRPPAVSPSAPVAALPEAVAAPAAGDPE